MCKQLLIKLFPFVFLSHYRNPFLELFGTVSVFGGVHDGILKSRYIPKFRPKHFVLGTNFILIILETRRDNRGRHIEFRGEEESKTSRPIRSTFTESLLPTSVGPVPPITRTLGPWK